MKKNRERVDIHAIIHKIDTCNDIFSSTSENKKGYYIYN